MMREQFLVLDVPVDAIDLGTAVARVQELARRESGSCASYICVRDVNGVVECQDSDRLRDVHTQAAMVTPDGMPIVWWGRRLGYRQTDRVYGPDLMSELCRISPEAGLTHFICGGGDGVADDLGRKLVERYPGLCVVGTWTPPFRSLEPDEYLKLAEKISASGAGIIWIGLSSPKQEFFMADLAPLLRSGVLIGVGAAFDFLSGRKPQAPRWIQRSGFEWLFRLATEPRRLWRRYLVNNSRFIFLTLQYVITRRPASFAAGHGKGQ